MTAPARWVSLDAVRGMTVAGMLLVNNPGTWDAIYPPLRHAVWHGWTPTDLIFPFFLFIVGITTELSLNRRAATGATDAELRRRIVTRGALIVLCGLLLTAFPYYPLTRLTEIRIPGVLQRIGICYAVAGLIAWRRSDRAVGVVTAALLLGYWAILTLVPAPGRAEPTIDVPDQTIAAWLDRLLLDGHLWSGSKTWDPEGPLSTIPAIGTSLLGILAGRRVAGSDLPTRLNTLFAAGVLGVVLGAIWGWVFPINKSLWTSSYVVFAGGAAALTLATVTWVVEVRGHRRWVAPFVTFGLNPLVAFLGSGALARTIGSLLHVTVGGEALSLQQAIYRGGFATWLSPVNASLAYAVAFVALWWLILRWFERRGWILRV